MGLFDDPSMLAPKPSFQGFNVGLPNSNLLGRSIDPMEALALAGMFNGGMGLYGGGGSHWASSPYINPNPMPYPPIGNIPYDEDVKKDALRHGLITAGLQMMSQGPTPYKKGIVQSLGEAGLTGYGQYQQHLADALRSAQVQQTLGMRGAGVGKRPFDISNQFDAFLADTSGLHGFDITSEEGYSAAVKWWGTPAGQEAWKKWREEMQKATATKNPMQLTTTKGILMYEPTTKEAIPVTLGGEPVYAPTADVNFIGERERRIQEERIEAQKKKNFPKARDAYVAANNQWDQMEMFIKKAIKQVTPYTAGIGSWLSVIRGGPQNDLVQTLNMVRANVGFDKLQQMRASSPTGGALGQVSDFEDKLLQAVAGSLDPSQSPAQLKENLLNMLNNLQRMRGEKAMAFKMDYGDMMGGVNVPEPTGGGGGGAPSPAGASKNRIRVLPNGQEVNISGGQ